MRYKAKLTGNNRDVVTSSPKTLITDIEPSEGLFRDHCWVDITDEILKVLPKGHHKAIDVEFDAELKEYLRRGTEVSYTLTNITNIVKLKG